MSDANFDFGALMAQAQAVQQQMMAAKEQIDAQVVKGKAGGGKAEVTVTGGWDFQGVHIDPSILDDAPMLEDLMLAALRDAANQISDLHAEADGSLGDLLG